MTTQKTQFENARAKFLNGMIDTSPTKTGAKEFKYEVKSPGVIHTTTRKNNVGAGLNELNAKKKANSATPKPQKQHANVMKEANELNPFRELRERNGSDSSSSSKTSSIDFEALASSAQADIDRMMMENINAFEQNPNVQSKSNPATIGDTLFGGINGPTTCLEPQKSEAPKVNKQVHFELPEQIAESPANTRADSPLDHNPIYQGKKRVSPDRFKPRPFLCSDIDGYVAPDKRNTNLVRCSNTHSGETFEPKMERKHNFQSDPSIKHVNGEIATCAITKGNGKKGVIQPDASHTQEPQSEISKVNVKELAKRFIG